MKNIILMVVIASVAADSDYYNLGKLNINEIINNTNELKRFVDCVLDKGACSKYGVYRAITAEAIEQACKKCSPRQKYAYWRFLQAVKTKFPVDFDYYRHKYDPENKYFEALVSELRKYSKIY